MHSSSVRRRSENSTTSASDRCPHCPLSPGDPVMVQSHKDLQWRPATVVADADEPRSFVVQDTSGTRYHRNCSFLKKLPPSTQEEIGAKTPVAMNGDVVATGMQDINVCSDKCNQYTHNKHDQDTSKCETKPVRSSTRASKAPQRLIKQM